MSILLQELHQIIQLSALLVLNGRGLIIAFKEVDRGESLHGHATDIHLVGSVVHLGNHHIFIISKLLTKLLPDGCCIRKPLGIKDIHTKRILTKSLAVATPRGVELNEDILVVVQHNVIEGLTLHNFDIATQILWGGCLTLQVGLQSTAEKVRHECIDTFHGVL